MIKSRRHKIVAKLHLLHNDDSLPTVAFASDSVKIFIQIVALHKHLRGHEDIDAALKAYDAERQPIGKQVVIHARKLGTHLGVDLKTEDDRRMHELPQSNGALLDWIAMPNFLAAYR